MYQRKIKNFQKKESPERYPFSVPLLKYVVTNSLEKVEKPSLVPVPKGI
jgi:hypothetical protein